MDDQTSQSITDPFAPAQSPVSDVSSVQAPILTHSNPQQEAQIVDPTVAATPVAPEIANTAQPAPQPVAQTNAPTNTEDVLAHLKNAKGIVITSNNNPSATTVAAIVGLKHLLKESGKKVNAVVSNVPKELDFLNPEEVITATVDNLRDFVVELDKEKADKLRYKVDGDLVKIFITPYKTAINKSDFRFELGDYNIDTVIVVEAQDKNSLDTVIQQHGELMHGAKTLSVDGRSGFDMSYGAPETNPAHTVMDLAEALGLPLNQPAAQALLSALAIGTNGFRNEQTTPEVMNAAAKLIGAGANQQQIMNAVSQPTEIPQVEQTPSVETPSEPSPVLADPIAEPAVEQTPEVVAEEPVAEPEVVASTEPVADAVQQEVSSEETESPTEDAPAEEEAKLRHETVLPVINDDSAMDLSQVQAAMQASAAPEVAEEAPAAEPSVEAEQSTEEIDLDAELTKTREAIKAATSNGPEVAPTPDADLNAMPLEEETPEAANNIQITHDGELVHPEENS